MCEDVVECEHKVDSVFVYGKRRKSCAEVHMVERSSRGLPMDQFMQ